MDEIAFVGQSLSFASISKRLNFVNRSMIDISRAVEIPKELRHPDGPVIGWGVDYYANFFVDIHPDAELMSEDKKLIYEQFVIQSQSAGMDTIPVSFRTGGIVQPQHTLRRRPVVAGTQITSFDNFGLARSSTLSYAGVRSGIVGSVVSGHAAPVIGANVYQPTVSGSNYIGQVADRASTYADASWVPHSDVAPEILVCSGSNYIRTVTTYGSPRIGMAVFKSGIVTGMTSGIVLAFHSYVLEYDLSEQFSATYACEEGDSGAPVYNVLPGEGQASIMGIHVGMGVEHALFSPQAGVYRELGVRPLTMDDINP